ncbi:8103_t:CDS:10 [Acaulospora morrowiae]|uniref:acylaminoacyl-peptidase n=1 Tax=Acaulospora morrowiae TaxID=94023 RepID=A0A9N8Z1K4_9GLOM|nr:8103_t:CDS:10 [Acaulospora morrowiae]
MSEKSVNNDASETEETVAVKTFKSLAKIPFYISANILPNSSSSLLLIQTGLSQRDLTRKIKRLTVKQLVVSLETEGDPKPSVITSSFLPIDLGDVVLQAISQSGNKVVTLKSVSGDKGKSRYVEIWKHGNLESVIDVTDVHEDFYSDERILSRKDNFGCLNWSKNEEKVVYIAERKALEATNEKKYDYKQSWGERLANKQVPVIVIVDITENKAKVLPEFHNIDPGQVLFGSDDETLIFTGYDREPRQFGLVACLEFIRAILMEQIWLSSSTRKVAKDEPSRELSGKIGCSFIPSIPRDASNWCCIELTIPHVDRRALGAELFRVQPDAKTFFFVQYENHIRSPSESFHENFPGIYCGNILPKSFFVINGAEYILINSYWRSRKVILAVNLTSGKVQNLTLTGSWTLFTVWDKYVVASQGFPNNVYQLNIGILSANMENNLDINWVIIDQPHLEEGVAKTLSKSTWSLLQPFPDKPNLEVIFHQPSETSSDKKPPLIVFPHGGPHGTSIIEISLYVQTLVSLGYAIIEVNYSGSTGFGQDYVDSLIGKIGDLDIEEVQSSAQYFIDHNYVDCNSVAVIGGSHGGFISGHLIGKYPDFYKACVMRNPVLNIGGMSFVTDIPDWCFAELGLSYDLKKPCITTPSVYAKMYQSSPTANIDKIKTPILLMLGRNDKRVPIFDGLQWWHYLKGQGKVDIRCKMYCETGHSLDTIEAEISCIDAISKFLKEKIGV